MRALVSILVSIALLAMIQASYIVASSSVREERPEGKHHHTDTSSHHHPHEKTGHYEHQKKKHREPQHPDVKKMHHDREKHKHKETKQEEALKPVVPPYFEVKDKHHNRYETQEDDNIFPTKKSKVRVERVEFNVPAKEQTKKHDSHNSRKTGKTIDFHVNDAYVKAYREHMQRDQPIKDASEVNHQNNEKREKKKNKKNKNKKNKQDKSQKKQKSKSEKKKDKKKNKKNNICETDEDCNGGCCIPKKGRKYCKKADFRDLGDKCASSCVCMGEMKCFVSEYKRNGERKTRKPGKRILGRCIIPSTADNAKGYFMEDKHMAQ